MASGVPSTPAKVGLAAEERLAVGGLAFLACQELVEGYRFTIGERGFTPEVVQSAWLLLLITHAAIGVVIVKGPRWLFWTSIVFIVVLAIINLRVTWQMMRNGFWPTAPSGGSHSQFRGYWLLARNAVFFSIPILLLVGRIRQMVKGRSG